MKFETKKSIIIILFVISIIINIFSIRSTYGKYQELVDTAYQVDIRKWYVVINGSDIQDEETVLSSILQPTLIENEHMKDNVIVPGREGFFEIDLDYTKVDVPFTYSFEVNQINEETKKLSDLEFFGYYIADEGSGFEIDSVNSIITYIGIEEGTTTETIDEQTGDKKVEFVKTIVDPETGSRKEEILTASLTTVKEETSDDELQVDATENDDEIIENANTEETDNYVEIGKITQVTRKVVDVTTGVEVEPEKVLFRFAQEIDSETKSTRFSVIQPQEPRELENFERYQNIEVYFRWNDDENNQMDNLADTEFRGEANPDTNILNTILKYEGTLEFKQYVEEMPDEETPEVATP